MNAIKFFLTVSTLAVFVIIAACGGSDKTTTKEDTFKPTPIATVTPILTGEDIYKKICIVCHQANGEGVAKTFPPLAKSDFLKNKEAVIEQVIKGKTGEMIVNGLKFNNTMPPQDTLTDEQISSVLTYVYGHWGNNGDVITAKEVQDVRAKLK
jgi:nitrite reductase (NO-forming)